ncbi:MAG TPA: lysine biosynthesis protein LysW [Planctomycetes bacterium]|nr:lysine biosynthesis protein LysW [Planctomycetota bacterium]
METEVKADGGARRSPDSRADCVLCGAGFTLKGRLMIGEVFDCPHCGKPLEIADLDPLAIEPFARIDEE